MFFKKFKPHILSLILYIFSCTLFTGICFISTYNISSSCAFGTSGFHDSSLDTQLDTQHFVAYNDVIISDTSFSVNGPDPFIVYDVLHTSPPSDSSSPLSIRITFDQIYSGEINLSIYYSTTENMLFSEAQRKSAILKPDIQSVYLTIPSNTTYIRLDIESADQIQENDFCVGEICLIDASIWDLLYNFWIYSRYFLVVGYVFILIGLIWVCTAKNSTYTKRILIVCYAAFMLLFTEKVFIYAQSIGQTPDEASHMAYMVYETEHMTEFVPHFEDISSLYIEKTDNGVYESVSPSGNYLGHPPLYYRLLSILGIVRILDMGETAYINVYYLYTVNIIIVLAGILLFLYIGYTRIPCTKNTIVLHVLWAAICTGIPMAAYETVGCNNDNLLYIEFAIFFLGILRYFEEKRNLTTYLLVSIGMSFCLLTKLTGGCVMVIMVAILFLFDSIQTKSIRMIANKQFLMTLPIYMIPTLYFGILYYRYGTIQPSLQNIDPENYSQSAWLILPENRIIYSMSEFYNNYFIRSMTSSWSCIYNGNVSLEKSFLSFWQWPFISLIVIALAGGLYSLLYYCFKQKKGKYLLGIASFVSLALTFLYNFYTSYNSYLNTGRLGGAQGRYYTFALPAIAFLDLIIFEDILLSRAPKKLKICVTTCITLFITWLLAADLPYTLNVYPTYFIG